MGRSDVLTLWSAKGGSGCSVVAAAVALLAGDDRPVLLVDLGGDLGPMLGVEPGGPGLAEWLAADAPPPDALARLECRVADQLSLLPAGSVPPASVWAALSAGADTAERAALLARVLGADERMVVADVGVPAPLTRPLCDEAAWSLLVTRPCFLALRRRVPVPRPDGVVMVTEPGRALDRADVADSVGAPVVASVAWDPSVARAVDAGTLARRVPRSLRPLLALEPGSGAW